MLFGPILTANITKFMSTNTCHMTTSLIFFNNYSTLALAIVKITHHKVNLILVTISFVFYE